MLPFNFKVIAVHCIFMPSPNSTSAPSSKQTHWTLYNSNEEAWFAMLGDCAQARVSIDLEQFIFTNDEFGKKLIEICALADSEKFTGSR